MVTRLAESVWQLSLRGVNGYVVDSDETMLVDAGTPWDEDRVRSGLSEVGIDVTDIDRILLTHFDLDHVGALPALASDLDAPVHIRAPDDAFLTGERTPPWTNHKGLLQRVLGVFVDTPDLTVETVEDGESIGSFTAYATPGHSPGHTAFVSPAFGVGMLGDLVRESGGQLEPSGWAISYDTTAVEESILELADRSPDFEVAAIGHGTPLTAGGSGALAATAERIRS
jgi:glyoxylase-like metal-dependent hydrolase (beta-lactamase superfamily II)